MELNARLVLNDCREAHAELVDGLSGSDWRRRWATVVTLLRATLHVLKHVDADADPRLASAIDGAWEDLRKTNPEPQLFWNFIEADRNLVLKEYAYTAGQNATVNLGGVRGPSVSVSYTMNAGPFAGEDPRDVAAEAIEWLDNYLNDVLARAEGESPSSGVMPPA